MISYYPAESLSWYSEALSKHACMPESFHRRRMISDISLGMVPSSMVSARCMSFLASSCMEACVCLVSYKDHESCLASYVCGNECQQWLPADQSARS